MVAIRKYCIVFSVITLLLVTSPVQADLSTVWGVGENAIIDFAKRESLKAPSTWNLTLLENNPVNTTARVVLIKFAQDGYEFKVKRDGNETTGITLFSNIDFLSNDIEFILPVIGFPFVLPLAIYDVDDYITYFFDKWKLIESLLSFGTGGFSQGNFPGGPPSTETELLPNNPYSNIQIQVRVTENDTVKSMVYSTLTPITSLTITKSTLLFGNFSLSDYNLTKALGKVMPLIQLQNVTTRYEVGYEIKTGILQVYKYSIFAEGWKLVTETESHFETFFQQYQLVLDKIVNLGLRASQENLGYLPLFLMLTSIVTYFVIFAYKKFKK